MLGKVIFLENYVQEFAVSTISEKNCSGTTFCSRNSYLPLSTLSVRWRDRVEFPEREVIHTIRHLVNHDYSFLFLRNESIHRLKILIRVDAEGMVV